MPPCIYYVIEKALTAFTLKLKPTFLIFQENLTEPNMRHFDQ